MNADGSGLVQLTDDPDWHALHPSWSPDGARIAFDLSPSSGFSDIYVMNADGSNVFRMANNSRGHDGFSAWSPDGSRIAFESSRDGDWDIYVMDVGN